MNMESPQEFNCIFCKESFDKKEDLQIHFRKHGDPKFNQSVKNKSRLPNDSQGSVDNNEKGERVSCDVCSDVFPTISKAITHKHKVHPDHDAKYFCPWCGKLFTMKHLYNKHIQTTHDSMEESEETGFHCDYCEVDFFVPSAMVYHNKFFHRQDTELAAIGHSKKLKLFNQELLQMYYCPFCGDEYCNKVNLHKHMGDDHIDEDQSPDDVLRCPLCDAIFYHLDAYELHLTFHSSKDTYTEENEMASEITEFSLETVPPIMEKVENDTQDGETNMTMGIEDLLQQAMNETNDGSNSDVPRKKSKKHKKHKKSKKAAITLDEFLNMNQDVFGEGIDFQGIEEVPEQVVNKQLKGRKAPLKPKKTRPKMLSTDIAKLKKQGIVVKMKSGKNINQASGVLKKGTPVKVAQSLLPDKNVTQTKAITSDEVLSKLLNQGNSQIKVVKRTAQDKPVCQLQYPSEELPMENKDKEDISNLKEEKEMEETSNVKNDIGDNHEEHVDSLVSKSSSLRDDHDPSSTRDNTTNDKLTNEHNSPIKELSNKHEPPTCDSGINKTEHNDGNENLKDKSKLDTGVTNPLNALRNINQHLTIKSLTSSNNEKSQQKANPEYDVDNFPESDRDNGECNKAEQEIKTVDVKSIPDQHENNSHKNSLNALKHLSHLITIKPVNKNASVAQNDTIKEKTDIQEIPPNKDGDNNKEGSTEELEIPKLVIKKGNPIVKEQPHGKEIPKSLDAFKNISKHVTIKSMTPKIESVDGKRLEDAHDDCDKDIDLNFKSSEEETDKFMEIKTNTILTSGPLTTKSVLYLKSPEIRTRSTSPSEDTDKFMGIKTNTKLTSGPLTTKSVLHLKSPEIRPESTSPSPKINRPATGNEPQTSNKQPNFKDETAANKESCSNILKNLPNLTTKQLNVTKNISQNVTVQSATQSMSLKGNIIKKSVTKEMNEDIEIFNIDDSDDEQDNSQTSSTIQTSVKPPIDTLRNVVKNDTQKSSDALKNLGKAITVKSTNQQNLLPNTKVSNQDDDDYDVYSNPSDHESDTNIIKQLDLIKTAGPVKDTSRKIGNTNINKPMDALKTLSKNITIKSSNKPKLPVSENVPSQEDMLDDNDTHSNYSDGEFDDANNTFKQNIKKPMLHSNLRVSANNDNGSRNLNIKKSMDALKNLGKHMTIKSSNQQKPVMKDNVSSLEFKVDDQHSNNSDDDGINNIHQPKPFRNMVDAVKFTAKNSVDESKEALKNLSKHITIKSTNQQKIPLNKSVQGSDDMLNKIDFDALSNYSDDEVDVTKNTIKKHVHTQSQQKHMIGTLIKTSQNYSKSEVHKSDSFKHLNKHITVKSSNQQKLIINKNMSCSEARPDFNAYSNDSDNEGTIKPERQNAMLQQKLQSLSKNITVKSRNSSPKTNVKSHSTQGFKHNLLDGYDSDSNSCPGNVNITELPDDNMNDAEALSQLNNTDNCQSDINCIVQSPSGSNSDNDNQDQSSDIESQIKSQKVKNPPTDTSKLNKQSDYLDSLKNISKHITVKSRKENNLYDGIVSESDSNMQNDVSADSHPNKELSIKPFKQMRPGCREDNETFTSRTINQSSTNQKKFTSDQVNTVNKEVTVKTFQTKTYIEEVTTTVTKTIRTVNQTVKQEVRNISQASSVPMIRPQRLPSIRPNLQTKNLQGTPVRQAMPTMGPRIRNPVPPIRPAIGARGVRPTNQVNPVRPSNQLAHVRLPNQLVPTRPGLNVVRPNNPRMPIIKKMPAATSTPQKPVVGKPLKISPHAKMQPTKRPAEDSTGHFSCFKKPKESLIPVSDVPVFNTQQDSGMAVHYASSSNMSKSNFTSTTKVVKGNSVVTSTQVKSEVSANSEQLSRLSNMSGLKIMKTSQTKQASHVEEKCEISASKRNALEAIQKLQKSGLLVKKPRLEDRFSDHSNSDVDDNFET